LLTHSRMVAGRSEVTSRHSCCMEQRPRSNAQLGPATAKVAGGRDRYQMASLWSTLASPALTPKQQMRPQRPSATTTPLPLALGSSRSQHTCALRALRGAACGLAGASGRGDAASGAPARAQPLAPCFDM
jgi:hypothetical protein